MFLRQQALWIYTSKEIMRNLFGMASFISISLDVKRSFGQTKCVINKTVFVILSLTTAYCKIIFFWFTYIYTIRYTLYGLSYTYLRLNDSCTCHILLKKNLVGLNLLSKLQINLKYDAEFAKYIIFCVVILRQIN